LGEERKLSPLAKLKLKAVAHNWIPGSLLGYRLKQDLKRWQRNRTGPLPHLLKQRVVLNYGAASGAPVFVETGTFYGHMLRACLGHFDRLISIEIEPHFYRRAQQVFRGHPNVTLLSGDSGEILRDVLRTLTDRCLFWLDAHYSGGITGRGQLETPIVQELEGILSHAYRHTVLIDDADCFDGTNGYPRIAWIENAANRSAYSVSVVDNIIRLVSE
jgi:hypothetical protein